ncbi:tyrosine-type recombinase/integrase [Nonomuraea sp. NPDC049152]|uniref:tyrosine-type recombinase/integrase n=1 Tax=Nonomuraea sp. NPDC049152 TaxID=3154350 RepID=UPI0033CE68F7
MQDIGHFFQHVRQAVIKAAEERRQAHAAGQRRARPAGTLCDVKRAGLDPSDWSPRELRHSFVSLLSDNGIPIDEISRLVGHSSTAVTELVYRKQIRPVLRSGAVAMNRIFRT